MADEAKELKGVKNIMTHAGGSSSNSGNVYIALDDWSQRKSSDLSVNSIIAKFNSTVVPKHPEAQVSALQYAIPSGARYGRGLVHAAPG